MPTNDARITRTAERILRELFDGVTIAGFNASDLHKKAVGAIKGIILEECPTAALREENEALKNLLADRTCEEEMATAYWKDLKEDNARLREALDFYADPDTYFAISFMADPPHGDFLDDASEVERYGEGENEMIVTKPGKRARAALAATEQCPGCGGSMENAGSLEECTSCTANALGA